MSRDRQYGKGGKGTKIWGEMISQAVKEGQVAREKLLELGYKFEPWGDGLLASRVTKPDGMVLNYPVGVNQMLELLNDERKTRPF